MGDAVWVGVAGSIQGGFAVAREESSTELNERLPPLQSATNCISDIA